MKFNNNKAIYLQIVDYIIYGITEQKWQTGDRIPSTRELAVELEVNPNTIVKSYAHLVDVNIIYNQRGIGFKVCDDALDNIIAYKKESFINNDLLDIFKHMDMLSISLDEISHLYLKYKDKKTISDSLYATSESI